MKKFIFFMLFLSHGLLWAGSYQGELIDAYSAIDHEMKDLETVIRLMEKAGVKKTLLSVKGTTKKEGVNMREEHAAFAEQFPGQIVPLLKVMGKHYRNDNVNKMEKKLEKWLDMADYKGIGDVKVYDLIGSARADKDYDSLVVKLTESRIDFFVEVAREKQWPFIPILLFNRMPKLTRIEYMKDMEELLSKNSEVNIILPSLGQLEPAEVRGLLDRHKNLHLYISRCTPAYLFDETYTQIFDLRTAEAAKQSGVPANEWGREFVLNKQWREIFNNSPDRFLVATFNASTLDWQDKFYKENIAWLRKTLGELDPAAANLIAHGNAERLWKL